jgi:hypothetical protein
MTSEQDCKEEGGVWDAVKKVCRVDRWSLYDEEVKKQKEANKTQINFLKGVYTKSSEFGKNVGSYIPSRFTIPRWIILILTFLVFTILTLVPLLGPTYGIIGAAFFYFSLYKLHRPLERGDKELELIIIIVYAIIWISFGLVSFSEISWLGLVIVGLIIDGLRFLPGMLDKKYGENKIIRIVLSVITFFITDIAFALTLGTTGVILSLVSSVFVLLAPVPAYVPFKPYFIPSTTFVLVFVKFISTYIVMLVEAIF